ncbi:MAG: hypothetical protein ACFFEF_14465 [Candidatus Thorarchaeota archaeon]
MGQDSKKSFAMEDKSSHYAPGLCPACHRQEELNAEAAEDD